MTGLQLLGYYTAQGRACTLLAPGSKAAFLEEWSTRDYTLAELEARYRPAMNIGWLTRGEADIDCDCVEAVRAARYFAPATGCIFGRPGKPMSHYWYRVAGAEAPSQKFLDPLIVIANRDLPAEAQRQAMIVEYRGKNVQTMAPGSLWTDGRDATHTEIVSFHIDGDGVVCETPGEATTGVLLRVTAKIAAAALLGRYWARGERHLCTLALAGWLGRHWVDRDEIRHFVGAALDVGGDEEERGADLDSTFAKLDAGVAVTGLPSLKTYLPEAVVDAVARWLYLGPATPEDGPAEPYHDSDIGLAERLRDAFGGQVRFVPRWRQWLYWDGTIWVPDEHAVVVRARAQALGKQLFREAMVAALGDSKGGKALLKRAQYASGAQGIANVVRSLETIEGVPVANDVFDRGRSLLTFRNGTVDLRDLRLRAHDPADMITKRCEFDWDEALALSDGLLWQHMPEFTRYLESAVVHPDPVAGAWLPDNELIEALQCYGGYSMTGETKSQIFFLLYGGGGNGKGVWMRLLKTLLRPHFKTASHSVFLGKKQDHDTVKAALEGCRICETGEVESGEAMAVALVKEFTGENEIEARRIGGNPYPFVPVLKLWMLCNHKPVIEDDSEGLWRRIKPIPWSRNFPVGERDEELDAKLVAEAGAILAWLGRGARDYYAYGMIADPQQVVDLRDSYKRDADLIQRFVDESCVIGPSRETFAQLHDAYLAWSLSQGLKPKAKRALSEWLRARYEAVSVEGAPGFRGISTLAKVGFYGR